VEQRFRPGEAIMLEGPSPCAPFSAMFEDDGDTGYFYALDPTRVDGRIIDALHVYNVKAVVVRQQYSQARIAWSGEGRRFALFINDYPHASFDLVKNRGYCRTGFPPPSGGFSSDGHEWSDEVLAFFK